MAGGKYDRLAGKTRPGTYINFESERNDVVGNSERGIVLLPLIGYDFGPAKTPITLTAAAPDAYSVELGRSVYDTTEKHMLLIREAHRLHYGGWHGRNWHGRTAYCKGQIWWSSR